MWLKLNPIGQKPVHTKTTVYSPIEYTVYSTNNISLDFTYETSSYIPSTIDKFCYIMDGSGEPYIIGNVWASMLKVEERPEIQNPWGYGLIECHATLPPLPDGVHNFTIYRGVGEEGKHQYASYITVTFALKTNWTLPVPAQTLDQTPTLDPTQTPNPTPSPSPSSTALPSISPSPSPSISPMPNSSVSPTIDSTLSPSPAPSLIRQPTLEPTQSASPTIDNVQADNFAPVIISIGLVAVTVVVSAMVYLMKHKK